MEKSENINELALALTKAQAEMGGAVMDADNPFFKSKYADLGSIIRVIKPPFAKHGLSYSQFPITSEDRIGVETVIVHESGQFISNEFTMRVPKADPQSAGGVISYCRRYALQAVCGIPAVDSDGEEYMQGAREESGDPIKEGKIRQSTNNPLPKKESSVKVIPDWKMHTLNKGKYDGMTLGEIAKIPASGKEGSGISYIQWMSGLEIQDQKLRVALDEAIKEVGKNGRQGFEQVG